MNICAGGRSALILTVLVCFTAPSQAAPGTDTTSTTETAAPLALHKQVKHSARRWKKHATRSSGKIVLKSDADRNTNAADQGDRSTAIPASVANANAQWQAIANAQWQYAETPTGNAAKAMSARAADILVAAAQPQPDTQIVSADQLNDVDRALHPSSPPASVPAGDPVDGRRRYRCAARVVSCRHQGRFCLGPDLAHREDIHRFRSAADDGLCRAHVHSVTALLLTGRTQSHSPRVNVDALGITALDDHPASGQIAPKSGGE